MYSEDEREKLLEMALDAIGKDDNLLFIESVCARIGICKTTFYEWWGKGTEEYTQIWEAINRNRCKVKDYIRLKLRTSSKASELLALYRMIATDEERRAINTTYTDLTTGGDKLDLTINLK